MFDPIARAVQRFDSWLNLLTGVGLNTGRSALNFEARAGDYLDDATLGTLYDLDGLAARIVRAVPQHALRQGLTVTTGDPKVESRIRARLDDLDAVSKLRLAWTWGRLYGGGAVFIGADDGRDPREPLNLASIRTVRFVVDVDRRHLMPHTWVTDPQSARFNQPETYQLLRIGGTASQYSIVHATRVIRFDGAECTHDRRLQLQGWGDSVLQRCYTELQQARGANAAVGSLMHEASQGVFKIQNLYGLMAGDKQDILKKRLELMDMSRSIARAIMVDADKESFERTEVGAMTGLVEVMDRFVNFLAAVSEIPVCVLMGQAPAGLNATGDSDIRSWYDAVAAEREAMLRRRAERLVRILMRAQDSPTGGVEPEGWQLVFPPLWQMTPVETATHRKTVADTDAVYIDKGVVTPEEVSLSRFRPEGWSAETSIDVAIRKAAQEAAAAGEGEPEVPPPAPGTPAELPPPGPQPPPEA